MLGIVAFAQAPFADLGRASFEVSIDGISATSALGSITVDAEAGVEVDRKMLADLAVHEPAAFAELVAISQKAAS